MVLSNQLSSRVIKYQKCTIKSKNKLVAITSIYIKQLNIGLLKASKRNVLAVKSNYATIQKTTIQKTSCQSSYKTTLAFSVSYYQTILHTFLFGTFLGSFYKIILHIFTEFISNNADTSRVTTKPYCKIILFCKFLSNETDILRKLQPDTTDSSTENVPDNTPFSLRCELIQNPYWLD